MIRKGVVAPEPLGGSTNVFFLEPLAAAAPGFLSRARDSGARAKQG